MIFRTNPSRLAFRTIALIAIATTLTAFAGCSGGGVRRYAVGGVVTYKGQPVKHGNINFLPVDGNAHMVSGGSGIEGGAYRVASEGGLSPGKYRVTITYPEFIPKGEAGKAYEGPFPKELLPEKYNRNSELTATIDGKSGTQTIDFKLD